MSDASPTPTLSVTLLDGTSKELKMTFNHLNRVAGKFQSPESAAMAASMPESRDDMIAVMFGERKDGKFIPANVEEIDLDVDQAGLVVDWVTDHISSFFVKRLATARAQLAKMIPEIRKMSDPLSSKVGSGS